MSGYLTRSETIKIRGADDLSITMLLDNQQFYDPDKNAERVGVCSTSWPLFGMLWPSSIRLAQKIVERPINVNERILELGCGLGIASLVAHRRGMQVTASDRHPMAQRFLQKNLKKNNLPPLRYKYAQWGQTCYDQQALEQGLELLQTRYNVIMASDVLYERDMAYELSDLINQHAMDQAEVWIVDPNRGYAGAFTRAMSKHGFTSTGNRLLSNDLMPNGQGMDVAYTGRFLTYRRN